MAFWRLSFGSFSHVSIVDQPLTARGYTHKGSFVDAFCILGRCATEIVQEPQLQARRAEGT